MSQSNETQVANAEKNFTPAQNALNVDCWEKLFDYLSFDDIYNLSQTCKRLHQIAGCYFGENFREIFARMYRNKGVYIGRNQRSPRNGLNKFIKKMSFEVEVDRHLHAESYDMLRELLLVRINLSETQISFMKEVLQRIEVLRIYQCRMDGQLHERILQYCVNLRSLCLRDFYVGFDDNWLDQEYPALEHLELRDINCDLAASELIKFLERNPNVKHLGIDAYNIWDDKEIFRRAKIRLDCLEIIFYGWEDDVLPFVQFADLLNELHTLNLYRSMRVRLKNEVPEDHQELIDSLVPLKMFEVLYLDVNTNVSALLHLKELWLHERCESTDMEVLASNLVNLRKLFTNGNDVLPFIRKSMNLQAITGTIGFFEKFFPASGVIDVAALNKERQKLKQGIQNPTTVTIYVPEDVYLATKWNARNTTFELVEIRRREATELGKYFVS